MFCITVLYETCQLIGVIGRICPFEEVLLKLWITIIFQMVQVWNDPMCGNVTRYSRGPRDHSTLQVIIMSVVFLLLCVYLVVRTTRSQQWQPFLWLPNHAASSCVWTWSVGQISSGACPWLVSGGLGSTPEEYQRSSHLARSSSEGKTLKFQSLFKV